MMGKEQAMANALDDPARMAVLIDTLQGLLNEDAASTAGTASGVGSARVAVVSIHTGARSWTAGLARRGETAIRPSPDVRGLVYSLTKSMMAAALLRLAARGVVDLDGPAEVWLPELADRPESVTVARILEHRAGLPDYGGRRDYHAAVAAGQAPWSEAEFLARCGVVGPPIGAFAYSNIGYLLIRRLLTRAGGAPFDVVLRQEVFAPLGLTSASVVERAKDLDGLLFGPSSVFGEAPVAERYHPGWVAHGVVAMTAQDAARFVHGLSNPDYLPDALSRRMRAGLPVNAPMGGRPWVEPSYGLGLMVELDPQVGSSWGHTGGGPGITPVAYHFPGPQPLSVAVFTDGEDAALAEWMAVETAQRLR